MEVPPPHSTVHFLALLLEDAISQGTFFAVLPKIITSITHYTIYIHWQKKEPLELAWSQRHRGDMRNGDLMITQHLEKPNHNIHPMEDKSELS